MRKYGVLSPKNVWEAARYLVFIFFSACVKMCDVANIFLPGHSERVVQEATDSGGAKCMFTTHHHPALHA